MKTNRVIDSEGYKRLGIKLHKYATTLSKEDFDLVTVKNQEYYIYNYVGDLKDRKNVSVKVWNNKGKTSYNDIVCYACRCGMGGGITTGK